ncbi:hypothetical protein J2Z42_001493 [Clostridium algifaecis]|uniref:Transposase n=1 Tax=Clostridium algifaecis TaxID=1472040 RepID=A0ABS4KS15_9CLOT|nr:hypothetical protein [Clostridium algifaecis]MBP2032819.1 hypothetical protein [Clostridium algifaecis]
MNVLEIPDIDLKKELKKCNSMEDLVGKNGLMQRLFRSIIQQFLEAEMDITFSKLGKYTGSINYKV